MVASLWADAIGGDWGMGGGSGGGGSGGGGGGGAGGAETPRIAGTRGTGAVYEADESRRR